MEWLVHCDEKGNVMGSISRDEAHSGSKKLHPVVHMNLYAPERGLLLQKRPENKIIQPGKWDSAVGGHISYGESVLQALRRESLEEIGLFPGTHSFLGSYIWETEIEKELVYSFFTLYEGDTTLFTSTESDELRFWDMEIVMDVVESDHLFTANLLFEVKKYLTSLI